MAPEAHQVLTDPDLGSEKVTRPQPVDFFPKVFYHFLIYFLIFIYFVIIYQSV